MIVRPMIGDWELPCIERVELHQARRQVRLGVPGLAGDLHQDLGLESLTVVITGSLSGAETRSGFLEALQAQFSSGDPVPFVADILESSELEDVIIVAFDVVETDEWVDAVRYRIVVRQYVEPPEPPPLVADLPLDELAGLEDLAGSLLDGLDLPALLGDIPALSDPSEPIRPALGAAREAVAGVPALLGGLRSTLGMPA
ncbi:hypothetical protein [Streptomyces sp. SID13031]|uniref:hypothetical protein n=1 Tax=Streptomyces sp. SID13031 TaxID=2706046 RepID=UPI0013C628C9|nr:hypothetical protein [Streptomyces sp. SID13031]NEA30696.1 hypothetical protein [Streptomyces sp. SID13031]